MQDKHIDELSYKAYKLVQDILFWHDNPKSQWYSEESYGSSFNTDGFCKEKAHDIVTLITTEQLAIWNKALELVGEDVEQRTGTNREADDGESWDRFYRNGGINFTKQQIRSAIQQQIDRIGGKENRIKYELEKKRMLTEIQKRLEEEKDNG